MWPACVIASATASATARGDPEPRRPHPGEHAEQRLGRHQVARVAGEAGLRGDGHDQHIGAAGERERAQHRRRAPPRHQRRHGERRGHDAELLDGVPQHGQERHVGELRRALRGGRARRVSRGEQAVGAERVGQQPADGDRDEPGGRRQAVPLPPQPQPVEAQERPHLGPQQAGGDAERERRAPAPREMREHGPEHRGGEPALGVAERAVEQPPRAERHHQRGDRAGEPAREPLSERVGARESEQRAHPPDRRPDGLRVAVQRREQRRDEHAQRLPGRPALGVQAAVERVVAPHHPHLRVERERPRREQRQRGHGRARRDERPAHAAGRRATSRRCVSGHGSAAARSPAGRSVATGAKRCSTSHGLVKPCEPGASSKPASRAAAARSA